MIKELLDRPQWCKLWRMMGVRHIVAFGLMAIIGDVNRFPNAKKLVGYIGLSRVRCNPVTTLKVEKKALEILAEVMCAHC